MLLQKTTERDDPKLYSKVLTWARSSPLLDPQGGKPTSDLLSHFYWWPGWKPDVKTFISSCTLWPSLSHPDRHLQPLPIHPSLGIRFTSGSGFHNHLSGGGSFLKNGLFCPVVGFPSASHTFFEGIFHFQGLSAHIVIVVCFQVLVAIV